MFFVFLRRNVVPKGRKDRGVVPMRGGIPGMNILLRFNENFWREDMRAKGEWRIEDFCVESIIK